MSTSILENNLTVIENRWPEFHQRLINAKHSEFLVSTEENTLVINDIQLTSNYDRSAEAQLQLSRINEKSEVAFVYGTGLGESIELLLKREHIKKVHVVILNLAVFLHIVNSLDQQEWLLDKRVELYDAVEIDDLYTPFIANPAELILADDNCVILRDKICTELNTDYVQQQFNNQGNQPLKNKSYVCSDKDISEIPKPKTNKIFITAAGPTLESHLDWIAKEKPYLIAVDAALATLDSNNITPDIVVSIDQRVIRLFNSIPSEKFSNTPLVYFPNVDSHLLEYWPGDRYCSYSETPMYSGYQELKTLTPLFSSGSVIHPAIDLAKHLQAQEIILLGADFSFVGNKTHATPDGSNKSELDVNAAKHWVFNYLEEKVPTMPNFIGYLRDLERYIAKNPHINFYSGSVHGAKIAGAELWKK